VRLPIPADSAMGADTLFLKSHTVTLANGVQQDIRSCCSACQHYLGKQCEHGFKPGGGYPNDAYIHCNKQWWGATEEQFTGGKSEKWKRPDPAHPGNVDYISGCMRPTALNTDPEEGFRFVCRCVDAASSVYDTSDDGSFCRCKAGHLPNVEAVGLCTACPAGTYQPVLEAACISCPAGEQSKQVQRQGDARCTAQRL
jgi:hypothetical protein